ncbi:hypothetical protein ACFO25_10420 [Paenactinomyces guangxiensis]|uniref:Uncharacterized protein n=1 Tax=Paenactinomyces guangxiensis TaxID=1490290 RepID=A0A7W2A9B5_9BACL|nr:hypothetical protein [Paenactinomyces guangxiensis]MBA4496441.1 hypothetical protein [Paenactinomyces guangxiensis]MBH8593557.1 hypothetical protein [Paenactinomyces guangxiensis]
MINSHSWAIYEDEGVAEKVLDQSIFLEAVTGIPVKTRPFFNVEDLQEGQAGYVFLKFKPHDRVIEGKITLKQGRTKLSLGSSFSTIVKLAYPNHYRFHSISTQHKIGSKKKRITGKYDIGEIPLYLDDLKKESLPDVRMRIIKTDEDYSGFLIKEHTSDIKIIGSFDLEFPDSTKFSSMQSKKLEWGCPKSRKST